MPPLSLASSRADAEDFSAADILGLPPTVAREVGVDVALLGRYFGSKESMFHEVLRGTQFGVWLDPTVGAEDLPSFLAALVLR